MAIKIIMVGILVFSMLIPYGGYLIGKRKKQSFKVSLALNVLLFFGTLVVADILLFSGQIYAADAANVANTANATTNALAGAASGTAAVVEAGSVATTAAAAVDGWRYMAAALSTGLSCIGAGVAVASAASAAIGALSEDSGIMGKALIFVALAESIALYGLLISFSILG